MICVPIVARTQAEALQEIEKSAPLADIVELRMDLIRGGNLVELISKAKSSPSPVKIMVTNRRKDTIQLSLDESQRIAILKEAVAYGADYIDVELDTSLDLRRELLSTIRDRDNRTKMIISHHDFSKTPSARSLKEIFHQSVKAGAGIVKIVTFARSPEDNLRVLSLIPYARRKKQAIIAFCMGEKGRISRIMAPLLGSFLAFASLQEGSESAAGQPTVGEIREIFRILKVEHG